MKLTVLNWFKDFMKVFLGRIIELIFRVILFVLPLGVYMFIMQHRTKVSSVSNLTVYTKDESVWQHVFPGFILVAIQPNQFKEFIHAKKAKIQGWIKENKYLLAMLFMALIVGLMVYFGKGI